MTAGMVSGPSIVPLKLPGSGKKWMIDSETPIELHSDTPQTILFYTVDGTKPNPFQKLGPKTTYKFTEPFFLSAGKHTVKAMAVLRDGSKESPVVTKTFQVERAARREDEEEMEQLDGEDEDSDLDDVNNKPWPVGQRSSFIESLMKENEQAGPKESRGPVKKAMNSTIYNGTSDHDKVKSINGYLIASQYLEQSNEVWGRDRAPLSISTSIHTRGNRSEVQLGRCMHCGTPNPVSPNASFCTVCGASLPKVPLGHVPPVDPGKMGICLNCHSSVPLNLPKCIICETPLHPERRTPPQGTAEKLLCLRCGTINPYGTSKCIVCEAQLTNSNNSVVKTNAPVPDQGKCLTCSKCGRVNSGNARFCDWCGSKPQPSSNVAICPTCRATNPVYSKFCSGCGKEIKPPARPEYSHISQDGRSQRMAPRRGESFFTDDAVRWIDEEPPYSHVKPLTKNISTQTSGLFYPSSVTIEKELKAHVENMSISEASRDRRVPITTISPGKGYWRQQLDHIFHHVKVYTQNNVDFRDSIGNLRIGKLFAALAQEELDGRELTLTLSFALKAEDKHSLKATARTVKSSLSAISALSESMSSKADSVKSAGSVKKRKKKKRETTKGAKKVTEESKMLIRKLSKTASGDINHFIEELIRDGANPNHQDQEGATPLKLAIKNGWTDCVSLLIDLGSDVNLQTGPKNTSALHEAVLLGLDGLEAIQVLLDNGADTELKNANGLTPYDMAVRSSLEPVISKFASKIGKDVLSEFGKKS